ncbi:hypothetical protein OS493_034329 [Desmophyllum pertusum]|uniref:Uncharacterized protein n=1 Tax=Desmophyllum pertusum TaxID=174260 RepID=A0A9W9YIU1_9CNID|nr:hypothetical protein OS493_034329 [Desmophyllum pertusum]
MKPVQRSLKAKPHRRTDEAVLLRDGFFHIVIRIKAFPVTATGDIRAMMIEIDKLTSSKAELCSLATPSKLQSPRKAYEGVTVVLFVMVICCKRGASKTI